MTETTEPSSPDLQSEYQNLLREKEENNKIIISIRDQIAHAKADVYDKGQYSDPHWFASANTALRHAGLKDQSIQNRLAYLKGQMKIAKKNINNVFIDVCRERLTQEKFYAMMDEAKRRME